VFFEACPTTLNVLIVHGKHDTNERIRGLVQEFRATLVETNQAHGLNMEYDSVQVYILTNQDVFLLFASYLIYTGRFYKDVFLIICFYFTKPRKLS
jgi:hypothetical protein